MPDNLKAKLIDLLDILERNAFPVEEYDIKSSSEPHLCRIRSGVEALSTGTTGRPDHALFIIYTFRLIHQKREKIIW